MTNLAAPRQSVGGSAEEAVAVATMTIKMKEMAAARQQGGGGGQRGSRVAVIARRWQ